MRRKVNAFNLVHQMRLLAKGNKSEKAVEEDSRNL